MRTVISFLTIVYASTATGETGRLFFDLAGNGGNQSAAHPGGLAMENPAAQARFYIYWQFGRPGGNDSQNVLGLNFNVTIDQGVIVEAMNYQPTINVLNQPRWQNVPGNPAPNPAANPGSNSARFTAININAFGLKNDNAAITFDQGYDAQSNTTLLGYVDVDGQPEAPLWLTVDTLGIAIQGGSPADLIYLGFGDAPVRAGGAPGTRSDIADAYYGIPEPGTMLLLAAGALSAVNAVRRPRRC